MFFGSEALASYNLGEAKETVKVFGFSPPSLEKRGWGRFYYKNKAFNISVLFFIKSPSIPLFQRGRLKREYFHSL